MFTTGSKLLIGSAVVAALAAVAYGLTAEGTLGTVGLASAAVALAFLAGINVYVRDSNVSATDAAGLESSPAAQPAPGGSLWPLIAGIGTVTTTVGLVTTQIVTVLGIAALLAAVVEWMVQAWTERASVDPVYNDDVRERVASPLELPILAAIGFGVVIYFLSRVMLSLDREGTVAAFAVVAALALVVGFLLSFRRRVSTRTITAVASLGVAALVAGGTAAGVTGERETHEHETTGDIAERGLCGPEETEADEKASQSVADIANVAATITLADDGLSYDQPGYDPTGTRLTLPRANPNNILFRNDTSDDRRLVINLGPTEEAETTVLCTALLEEGGEQLLTVTFSKPSFAVDNVYQFFVPGVDGAVVDVVVP